MYVRTSSTGLNSYRGLGDLVSSMAAAITQMEGVNPNFVGNNNPGNIVFIGSNQNGQSGVTRGAGGFAQFSTLASGQAALDSQIQYQINQGQSLTDFFNQYAPGNTKNAAGGVQTPAATQNYINFVSGQLGIDPSVPLNSVQDSYSGPGSVDTPDYTAAAPDTSGAGLDLSSYLPTSLSDLLPSDPTQYDLGGLVLSGSDLLILGITLIAGLAISRIL